MPHGTDKIYEFNSGDRSLKSLEQFALQKGWESVDARAFEGYKTLFDAYIKPHADDIVESIKTNFLQWAMKDDVCYCTKLLESNSEL